MNGGAGPVFDRYKDDYIAAVQDSVRFSGIDYGFFLRSKAALLRSILAERLAGLRAPSLLDVGCGIGALHPLLENDFGGIHGVDVSAEGLTRAETANPWATYQVYDGVRLPVADGAFDMALAICVLHHVSPALWPGFFAELKRAVRPGGLVCVIEHNPFNPLTRLSVLRCEFDKGAHLIRRSRAVRMLGDAGLTGVDSRYFVFAPSTSPAALRIERRLSRVPLGAQYAAYGQV